MAQKVTASFVIAHLANGKRTLLRKGRTVTGLVTEDLARLTDLGAITPAEQAATKAVAATPPASTGK